MTKDDALNALRTWNDWYGRRDALIRAARLKGATLDEIEQASGRARGTVLAAIARKPASQPETTMDLNLSPAAASYHHPHYTGVTVQPRGLVRNSGVIPQIGSPEITACLRGQKILPDTDLIFHFRPFTGRETFPETPSWWRNSDLTDTDQDFLQAEWHVAEVFHGQARFRLTATPAIKEAAPVWDKYMSARTAMDSAYAVFAGAPDGQWRSLILALVRTQAAALDAAREWDRTAGELTGLENTHLRDVGEENELTLRQVAAETGMDISSWDIRGYNDYNGYGDKNATARDISRLIEQQHRELKQVAALAGDKEVTS